MIRTFQKSVMCISVTLTVESMKKLSLAFQHNSACSVDSVCPPLISIVLFSIKIIHYSFMYFSWLNRLSFFFRDTFISLLKLLIGIFGNVCLFPIILMHSASLKGILYKYYHKKQLFNLICNPLLLVTSARPPPHQTHLRLVAFQEAKTEYCRDGTCVIILSSLYCADPSDGY